MYANQYKRQHQNLREYLAGKSMPEPNSGCLLWLGPYDQDGYGMASWNMSGRTVKAHRAAYELHCGPIPAGKSVCHSCDVRACIEPRHLWLGSNADNVADREKKGRTSRGFRHAASFLTSAKWQRKLPRGEGHKQSKLTEAKVRAIRRDPRSLGSIASDYGVSPSCVGLIKRGVTWADIS